MIVAFVSGNFNILHPGHLRLFRFAKESSTHLIVGVMSDRMAGPSAHVPESLRLESVSSNTWVDQAVLIDELFVLLGLCSGHFFQRDFAARR